MALSEVNSSFWEMGLSSLNSELGLDEALRNPWSVLTWALLKLSQCLITITPFQGARTPESILSGPYKALKGPLRSL